MTTYSQEYIDRIVDMANVYAINSFRTLHNGFPDIKCVSDANLLPVWDYITTITCVSTTKTMLTNNMSKKEMEEIFNNFKISLERLKPNSSVFIEDFESYVTESLHSNIELQNAIGKWIWGNMENYGQSNKEIKKVAKSSSLLSATGILVLGFFNWAFENK